MPNSYDFGHGMENVMIYNKGKEMCSNFQIWKLLIHEEEQIPHAVFGSNTQVEGE